MPWHFLFYWCIFHCFTELSTELSLKKWRKPRSPWGSWAWQICHTGCRGWPPILSSTLYWRQPHGVVWWSMCLELNQALCSGQSFGYLGNRCLDLSWRPNRCSKPQEQPRSLALWCTSVSLSLVHSSILKIHLSKPNLQCVSFSHKSQWSRQFNATSPLQVLTFPWTSILTWCNLKISRFKKA